MVTAPVIPVDCARLYNKLLGIRCVFWCRVGVGLMPLVLIREQQNFIKTDVVRGYHWASQGLTGPHRALQGRMGRMGSMGGIGVQELGCFLGPNDCL